MYVRYVGVDRPGISIIVLQSSLGRSPAPGNPKKSVPGCLWLSWGRTVFQVFRLSGRHSWGAGTSHPHHDDHGRQRRGGWVGGWTGRRDGKETERRDERQTRPTQTNKPGLELIIGKSRSCFN